MSKASDAAKMFADNCQRYGNPHTEPEKYNLYNGRRLLAEATEELRRDIQQIEHAIRHLR